MRKHKAILATMAVALPVGLMAAVAGPTMMAGAAAAAYPAVCSFNAQVNFSPPLIPANSQTIGTYTSPVHQGYDTTDPTAMETVTVTGPGGGTNPIQLSNCLSSNPIGSPGSGTITPFSLSTTASKTYKTPNITGDVPDSKVQHYQYGACDTFTGGPGGSTAKTTLKTLKSLNLSDTWTGQPVWSTGTKSTSFAASGTGFAGNGDGELGFVVFGKTSGDYAANQVSIPSSGKAQISALLEIASGDGLNWSDGCATGTVSTVHIDPATSTLNTN